jgi:hypothetical protein
MMWADKDVAVEEIQNALELAKRNEEFHQKDIQAINHLYEEFPEIVEIIFVEASKKIQIKIRN